MLQMKLSLTRFLLSSQMNLSLGELSKWLSDTVIVCCSSTLQFTPVRSTSWHGGQQGFMYSSRHSINTRSVLLYSFERLSCFASKRQTPFNVNWTLRNTMSALTVVLKLAPMYQHNMIVVNKIVNANDLKANIPVQSDYLQKCRPVLFFDAKDVEE